MCQDSAPQKPLSQDAPGRPPEHQQIGILARRCMRTAEVGSHEQIRSLCREAVACCDAWLPYFAREEAVLFPFCEDLGGDIARLCRQLQDEHRELQRFCRYLKEGECSALYGFGALLHAHCRTETGLLLPLVEAHLDHAALTELRRALAGGAPDDSPA